MLLLFFFILQVLRSHSHAVYRGISLTAIAWMLLYIAVNDMRLVAPAFMMGVFVIRISDTAEPAE
jgi:hypothetical protein